MADRKQTQRPATDPLLYIGAWSLMVFAIYNVVTGWAGGAFICGAGTGLLHGLILSDVWSKP